MDTRKTVLSLAIWIAVASPSGSSPSGSRVRSISPPGDSVMDAHHITSKHPYLVSKDRSSLPPTAQPLPSSCWPSHCPTEGPWRQPLWVFGRAVALPWEPFLPVGIKAEPKLHFLHRGFPDCSAFIDCRLLWTFPSFHRHWGITPTLLFFLSVILGNLVVAWQLDGYVFEDRGWKVAYQDLNMDT